MNKLTLPVVTITKSTKKIEVGLELMYDGSGSLSPVRGTIIQGPEYFFISWADCVTPTPLDGSDNTKEILKYCKFNY